MSSLHAKSNVPDIGRRVIEVPELLTLVAREFSIVGPIVWRKVPRLDLIMKLIIGTSVKYDRFRDSQSAHHEFTEITIVLPSNLDLGRFNIYAPWVHELEIFRQSSQEIQNVKPFLTLLDGRPPLPNLRRLTTHTGATNLSGKELLDVINIFFSPSLKVIRTIFHEEGIQAYLDASSVPTFFKKIEETCPQIEILEFYPQNLHGSPGPFMLSDQSRAMLQSFSNLRSFTSAGYILESATFGILGSLPHLESLGIRGEYIEDPILDEQLSIPGDSFGKLVDLRLHDIHPQDIKTLWSQPHIVNKLISVLIRTDPTIPPNLSDNPVDGNSWIELFLLALPGLSPRLKSFIFYVGDEDGSEFQVSQEARDGLNKLGLRQLKLKLDYGGY
ncbi:hypothetical protein RHS04_01499 [Rhizoctonia solani]|uniref:Uncharacterized protein n=1 Tax=Rhizoctonia solani TaxID=456999 RepID=A0A8H7LN79_9AGAM|nr:hypothetical protein RHS04_01499 [Rhizoctonia solani]